MIPISVVIPVKNEEKNIHNCLQRLGEYDEVVVVDSGSTDSTCTIAEEHGASVIQFEWNGHFPKKRNWVLRNITLRNAWVLFLDADEYVSDEFNQEVEDKVAQTKFNGFWITYQNYFMGRRLNHGDTMRKLALFRVGAGEYEKIDEDRWSHLDMEIHEHPIIAGRIGFIRAPICHHDYNGYEAYLARHNAYSSWEAQRYLQLQYNGFVGLTKRQKIKYRLMGSWLLGPLYFVGVYFLRFGFLDGRSGLLLAFSKMIYFFQVKCKIDEILNHNGNL
ncbi:MAG TPA: glycosyltransferase family 2 protein [Pontiella sp.]